MRTLRRTILALLIAAGTGFLLPLFGTTALPPDCGKTTLEGQLVRNEDGVLVCAPGQGIVVRQELGTAKSGRANRRNAMRTFGTLADFQLADEESPLRGEWADKCNQTPFGSSGFRPHETLVPHMMNAHVRALNRVAKNGGPILKQQFNFAVALGDLADNQQLNETRWFIDILDGKKLLNPDTGQSESPLPEFDAATDDYPGPDDYDGVMNVPPTMGSPPLTLPQNALPPGMLVNMNNLANEPFWVEGLKRADGTPMPWYTVMGNHDVKVQGTIPDDNPTWRAMVRAYAVGHLKIPATPDEEQAFCDDPTPQNFASILLSPSTTRIPVPKDSRRMLLNKIDWIEEHDTTTGVPDGHGFNPSGSNWCPEGPPPTLLTADPPPPSSAQTAHRRGCYHWIDGLFHFITLDTNPLEGLQNGNIDETQFNWLEDRLKESSKNYFDENNDPVSNPTGKDRLIVIFAHHPITNNPPGSMDNRGYPSNDCCPSGGNAPGVHTGDELNALLLRYPNVILLADGHSHQNRIWPHENDATGTGYWEVNTSAIADFPTHSRTIELADNRDGTISIFSVVFDARGAANPREINWLLDDPTNEITLGGAARRINEEWLASAGREILYNDPQQGSLQVGGSLGAAIDRNVELIIKKPFSICRASGCDPR